MIIVQDMRMLRVDVSYKFVSIVHIDHVLLSDQIVYIRE
jgi:hypothetical protein